MISEVLASVQRRLHLRAWARLVLILSVCSALGTAAVAVAFVALVPTSGGATAVRVAFLLVIVALGVAAFYWLRPTRGETVRWLERVLPGLDGRLITWADAESASQSSSVLTLLSSKLERELASVTPTRLVPAAGFAMPVCAGLVVAAGTLFAMLGDGPHQLAAQRLWLGDALSAGAPRIAVEPGDIVVPRSANVVIDAAASGFQPGRLEVRARFEGSDTFEAAPMTRSVDGHRFVFVAVTDEIDYYVVADGLTSDRFRIRVADLPRVTAVSATYSYPTWTHLPDEQKDVGALAGVVGTGVNLMATTTEPVAEPVLVVNGDPQTLEGSEAGIRAALTLAEAGSWHFAVRHEGILTRISDRYPIALLRDQPPEIAYTWPGHDRPATSIEEVAIAFEATDDFGVERLHLRYSVNGGDFAEVQPGTEGGPRARTGNHVFYLEDLQVGADDSDQARGLRPGDIVSFHAEASDHTSTTRSSLYFIDVRPFDRQYREADQGNGGDAGGSGFEVAERQREILAATWNLINRRDTSGLEGSDLDQILTLAAMQRRLQTQVQTLIARAGARDLTNDGEMDRFMAELNAATEEMAPAAEQLERQGLDAAIGPEQRALQHLLAAEATMRDVDVAFGDYEGGRGTSGRSLEELVEIELDPERNRYEVPETPDFGQADAPAENDWRELEELAARQQRLAERAARDAEEQVTRWQQESLQRELETARERLESRSQGGSSSGESGQLERALRSMEQARAENNPALAREAGDLISESARQMRGAGTEAIQDRIERGREQVDELLVAQALTRERLDELAGDLRAAVGRGEELPYYDFSMEAWGTTKRRMQSDLAEVTRELEAVRAALEARNPQAAGRLGQALDELNESGVDGRLNYVAAAFELGRPLLAGTHEAEIERSLQTFARQLDETANAAGAGAAGSGDALTQLRQLRAALGAGGGQDAEGIARQVDQLLAGLPDAGVAEGLDTTLDREHYVALGTDDTHSDALLQMVTDRIDLIEARLLRVRKEPLRAQDPRDALRDSEAVSDYYTRLSTAGESSGN